MRYMRSAHAEAIVVAAAHSRVIIPGDVVDFDEAIAPAQGASYSLETALGHQAEQFEPAEPPQTVTDEHGDEQLAGVESAEDLAPARRSRRR